METISRSARPSLPPVGGDKETQRRHAVWGIRLVNGLILFDFMCGRLLFYSFSRMLICGYIGVNRFLEVFTVLGRTRPGLLPNKTKKPLLRVPEIRWVKRPPLLRYLSAR